jgi:hypothetical protein
MTSDIAPPTRNITKLNHRYIEPMSLWLVVVIQRIHPGRTVAVAVVSVVPACPACAWLA